ncbi:MAG: TusE/DsrC/DsvC family sulfur relay protein [Candidatus Marinimicrobia bacterium]|jgi:tRNA 2-thiouridine synthesizing protein E|nr:TusE/DsrC/DsvC family sulfur relay protein [Candidatus Neomarinimicrobiota bacterium]MBT3634372.1 TusE/DsrC/DsvC family sulfur relay protein [Candidatus Neomarinimicrobiota bacterium]MBT3681719.1 TusE/DsrC/DsvC family sulfur relay protein [Candidatus Neomarinimicrobiota bacterium]MBT3759445.1 TusE/DsrC/DsvC family sulfur relay protein [Candidatus Neomarinimicrobiota bacterium]MBT3895933.1 TusE/DsrC/DsvC family sulfur relay protein [Candidatus Neomarinimicrobiota bacterium]
MSQIEIAELNVDLDDQGYLTDHNQWTKEIAVAIAGEEGIIELTDRHFVVIDFMRKEFKETGTGPSIRRLTKQSGVPTKELYALFPGGPAKKAARIAGIKKPEGCI